MSPQVADSVWFAPASAVVGFWLNFISTSSVEAVQGSLEIVQRKVYAVPAVPEKVVVGLVSEAKDPPVPLTIVHLPVPTVGVFPARVTVVSPQVADSVWFAPALAVVGFMQHEVTVMFLEMELVAVGLSSLTVSVTVYSPSPAPTWEKS